MRVISFFSALGAGLLVVGVVSTNAKSVPKPIIDVHVHAQSVASYGPPGQKFCTPYNEFKSFDPGAGKDWPQEWVEYNLAPDCEQ